MVRLDPDRELKKFVEQLDDSMERYRKLYDALEGSPEVTNLRKGISVDAVFRLGSAWEIFQHNWHIAAIAQDSSKIIERSETTANNKIEAIDDALVDLYGIKLTKKPQSKHLTKQQIELLLDPSSRNVTFFDMADWVKAARRDMTSSHIAKLQRINSNEEDSCVLDLLKAIRNVIAHGSENANALLTLAVRPRSSKVGIVGPKNDSLIRAKYAINDIGTYLHGWPAAKPRSADMTRVALLHQRVKDIAQTL
jgi:hypothetical protein